MLKHETERLNRNEELLHILENAHVKAARMASNTERLKKLKVNIGNAQLHSTICVRNCWNTHEKCVISYFLLAIISDATRVYSHE